MRKQLYITHGYTANSQSHWFQWLKNQLIPHQIHTNIFDMPDSSKPNPQIWLAHHQTYINQCDENTVFIGHSLGCIATLRYLQRQKKKIKGLILVAGFDEPLDNLPELTSFTLQRIYYPELIANIPQRIVIGSSNDEVVAPKYTQKLAANLQASYLTVENAGHFLARQGFTEFPLLLKECLNIFNG
ncbi:RBBP9/YdeN family alpha/beta hydrolase [[Mannheimia] succiniciproducens]|uniref:Serine hydrolase family protein n=1 Tax=Mannheimia succiniciproducens (strain KCTC 0769BP / MBEL55E) TaxID=221988 RepID=Q65PX2_MANSM|nr:alpha/beta hydrolase [[Mannheimia] succiniciproducens]AAU38988.1 unknown [[Mannheimia] succiniciproducens MBEL55E]